MDWAIDPPEAERQAGDRQSQKQRDKLGPRGGTPFQTVSRLPAANQVFLGSWTADIHQEGQPEISSPEETHGTPQMVL